MSAMVCGSKRSYYEELTSPSPPLSKRHRCTNTFSPLLHLESLFPRLHPRILERALEDCGNDLDSAIKSLNDQTLDQSPGFGREVDSEAEQGALPNKGDGSATKNTTLPSSLLVDGAEWVDVFVKEMMNATSIDDAKCRASRMLETLEKSIRMQTAEETTQNFQKESLMRKEQMEALVRENTILKRAVALQHERQVDFEDKSRELQQLKQLVSQYQEQLRTLEVNNYALMMHLRQAEQSSPIPGRFHPDVF